MSTENTDDLFRRQLGSHETPPGDDLWARLQAGPNAAALPSTTPAPEPGAPAPDQLFQQKLNTHATPPPREIWERLEDEHIRPRKHRAAAWWPMAMAAAVALLLLAGGGGLWLSLPGGAGQASTVASQSNDEQVDSGPANSAEQFQSNTTKANTTTSPESSQSALAAAEVAIAADGTAGTTGTAAAGQTLAQASETRISGLNQKNPSARATRPASPASSASKVEMMAQQSPRRPRGASRQPDAAAASAPLVARTTPPLNTPPTRPADEPAPAVASAHLPVPTPTPAGEIVPAATAYPATLAAATLITVDVRNGAARRPSLATAVASAAAATEERQGLGGRLLRQVGHAVRGERLSLSEVTGLPENLTLEATIAGRRVSKSIQL